MMNSITSPCAYVSLLPALQRYLAASISLCAIPDTTHAIALNFKHSPYLTNRTGQHPLEVHLFRSQPDKPWQIATMTSFAFTDKDSERLEVELYFNFRHQWFYQPDIKRCELNQPHVIELFHCWQGALVNTFNQQLFDHFTAKTINRINL
ncbi:MAG: DUF2787 family protein [Pseudoalteromonas sp.]|uniref:DUF2787 family protein n=1 Tax=Pseudoalteromonas TaxID=53246 RepID=UPI0019826926|nr:DUF2787 family protein [Pseudoalteromonas sp. Z9A6]